MRRKLIVERVKGVAAALAFVGMGLFLRWADGPPWLGWLMIGFGTVGLLAIIAGMLHPRWRARADAELSDRVVLKDGRDYRADVTDADVRLTHLEAGDARQMTWAQVTSIWAIAIDGFPAGSISWVLHAADERLEIPWDVQGSKELLAKMQDKFPDFDNRAVIECGGMLHGFRQIWPPSAPTG